MLSTHVFTRLISTLFTIMPALCHLDEALSAIRQSLLHQPHPVLVKIVNESGQEELHVFKVDPVSAKSTAVEEEQISTRTHQQQPHQPPPIPLSPRNATEAQRAGDQHSRTARDLQPPTSHDLQRELRAQHHRIQELEEALLNTKEELRRVLLQNRDGSSSDGGCSNATGSESPSSPTAAEERSTSNVEASVVQLRTASIAEDTSDVETRVSMLQLAASIADHDSDDDIASTTSDSSSDSSNDAETTSMPSRKSNRQRQSVSPLDHRSSSSSPSTSVKRKNVSSSDSKTSTTAMKKIKQSSHHSAHTAMEMGSDDIDDEGVEIAALVTQLKEAYERRAAVSLDSVSPSAVLQLTQHVLSYDGERTTGEPQQASLQQCANQITSLINTSTTLKMVGHYLRGALAHRLKQGSSRNYSRLARDVLGICSSADIAVYPALYELVQKCCPAIAAAGTTTVSEVIMEGWLREPLFMADIGWSQWRRYLSRSYKRILEVAVERFLASIEPFKDWMKLGWVEVYDCGTSLGQGVRAVTDIHMPATKGKKNQRDISASISIVAADLNNAGPDFVKPRDQAREEDPAYDIPLDRLRVFDARHHWVGKINHLPTPHCNVRITGSGKLAQTKPIKAGDALALDYGVDYWVYQITGLDVVVWRSEGEVECRKNRDALFTRMHKCVSDYSSLLKKSWVKSLSSLSSAVEKEEVLQQLEQYLSAMRNTHD